MKASRREFIRNIGLAGLATMTLPRRLVSNNGPELSESGQEKKLTILFQGDSITDGNRSRDNDWNHVLGHGYAFLIASRLSYEYPDQHLLFYNRGISGNRICDLEARWQRDALDLKPDVLSILIGVNDIQAMVRNNNPLSIEQFKEAFTRILDKTKAALPDTLLVLCEPFILSGGRVSEKTEIWQTEMPRMQQAVRKLADTHQAILIELQKPFEQACQQAPVDYWIWDGVHPMPAGHELIARQWIKQVRTKLTFIKE